MSPRRRSNTETPELKDLRAFCLAVDLGTITGAARAVGETKGSVSRRLSRLEAQLGVPLLRRGAQRVTPTEEGIAYRARLVRPLELLDEAQAALQNAAGTPRGRIRVTAANDFALLVLAPLVATFLERYPGVGVDFLISDRRLDFDRERLDLAFRAAPSLEDSSLVAKRIGDVHGQFFASQDYVARLGLPSSPSELAHHRLLSAGPLDAKGSALKPLGPSSEGPTPLTFALRASDFAFVRELAIAGAGLALLPTELIAMDIEQKRLVPILPDYAAFSGGIFLIHRGGRNLTPAVRAFRDYVMSQLAVPRRVRS